jgi:hypothetical protein
MNSEITFGRFSANEYLFDIRSAYKYKYLTSKITSGYSEYIAKSLYNSDIRGDVGFISRNIDTLSIEYDIAVKNENETEKEKIVDKIKQLNVNNIDSSIFRLSWERNVEIIDKDNVWIFLLHMQSIFDKVYWLNI